jgi:hypothetical protein
MLGTKANTRIHQKLILETWISSTSSSTACGLLFGKMLLNAAHRESL